MVIVCGCVCVWGGGVLEGSVCVCVQRERVRVTICSTVQ